MQMVYGSRAHMLVLPVLLGENLAKGKTRWTGHVYENRDVGRQLRTEDTVHEGSFRKEDIAGALSK